MKKFFKIIIITFSLLIFLGATFIIYFINYLKEDVVKVKTSDDGTVLVEVREEEKGILKSIVLKLEKFIYREATEHNPEGDLLPDEIDDIIKDKIKNMIE